MSLELTQTTALDLTLKGSTGSFKVGTGKEGQNSLEVKYFLTHVGLDFSKGSSGKLLSHLAPVREIFNFEQLDFDEIMQRDIDDARVSSELIPYLLDDQSADLIKLFPPIIVVVLPTKEGENRPADKYPEVKHIPIEGQGGKPGKSILRSGAVGSEVFEFEQPIHNGEILNHDLVFFRINTNMTRLVIVDGQHRAMALLALHRNLMDQWSDEKRAPYKEYYEEWTPKFIREFNLKEINLPIMLCTFPSLDESYKGDYDIKKASRAIFLTLNKTARKVSSSRNILLDDNDIIAYFLRSTLSEVKKKDSRSPYSFRIHNVELDQFEDKQKIQSPIALTGVSHVYYIVEHLMLDDGGVNGSNPRPGKFWKRKSLNDYGCMGRLDGRNILGAELADTTTRDSFTEAAAKKLAGNFNSRYGQYIIEAFEKFAPFEHHNRAVLELESNLEIHEDRKLLPILFQGQGISRVFEEHRANLKAKLQTNAFRSDVPKIESIATRLDATASRIAGAISFLKTKRAELYVANVIDKSKLKDEAGLSSKVVSWFNDLYDNVFTTVAFQTALICGFFGELEKANAELFKNAKPQLDYTTCFTEYVEQLNKYFIPQSASQFKKLVNLFSGEFNGEIKDWKIQPSQFTFRTVVYRGEMQPDQWPKYKYLLLEIWRPTEPELALAIDAERNKCRDQIFSSLYNHHKAEYCRANLKLEETLAKEEIRTIFNTSYDLFCSFLKNLDAQKPQKDDMRRAASIIPAAPEDDSNGELWESAGTV